jgi:hypothetical protein
MSSLSEYLKKGVVIDPDKDKKPPGMGAQLGDLLHSSFGDYAAHGTTMVATEQKVLPEKRDKNTWGQLMGKRLITLGTAVAGMFLADLQARATKHTNGEVNKTQEKSEG